MNPAANLPAIDWKAADSALDERGFARLPALLSAADCAALFALYEDESHFRRRVVMAQHGYGRGEYRYFAYPLPPLVEQLRARLYPPLAAIANRWQAALGDELRFPPSLAAFLRRCRTAGQTRPTPLLLDYGAGDFNCLHQDRYGEVFFPLQVAVLLSEPGTDFEGGEFLLVERRPRRQSLASVVPLERGDAVVFAGQVRPVMGRSGCYRAELRHGVSEVRHGHRRTLGIIFHDAA